MLITPKAARTPAASKNAAMTSPAITRSDITAEATRNFYDRSGHESAQRGCKESDRGRDFFGPPDAAERNAALGREFGEVGFARERFAGCETFVVAAFPLTGVDHAEQDRVEADLRREIERQRLREVECAGAR